MHDRDAHIEQVLRANSPFLGDRHELPETCQVVITTMSSMVPRGVKNLRKSFNVAFLTILLDALEWPDVSLCSFLMRGFSLEGDLSAQDSNIFAPKEKGEVLEDYVRFERGWAELQDHESNLKLMSECEQMLLVSGRQEQQSAEGDPLGESLLKPVMIETTRSTENSEEG